MAEEAPRQQRRCPFEGCGAAIVRVSGFAAPMNLPGEEAFKVDVPEDGKVRFESIKKARI